MLQKLLSLEKALLLGKGVESLRRGAVCRGVAYLLASRNRHRHTSIHSLLL